MSKYDEYVKRQQEVSDAESWQNLPRSKNGNSLFKMSPAHCEIKLMRCGQHLSGGQNYWDSPKVLNAAILEVIAADPAVIDEAIHNMKELARLALTECEEETRAQLASIEEAKNGATLTA